MNNFFVVAHHLCITLFVVINMYDNLAYSINNSWMPYFVHENDIIKQNLNYVLCHINVSSKSRSFHTLVFSASASNQLKFSAEFSLFTVCAF